jgi:hypothetical protein
VASPKEVTRVMYSKLAQQIQQRRVLGYIGILYHKEHPHEVWHIPPRTPCIYIWSWPSKFDRNTFVNKVLKLSLLKNIYRTPFPGIAQHLPKLR